MNNNFSIKFENSDYSDEGNLRRWILFKALKLPILWKGSAFTAMWVSRTNFVTRTSFFVLLGSPEKEVSTHKN